MLPDSDLLKYWQSYSEWGFRLVIMGVVGESIDLIAKWLARCRKQPVRESVEKWLLLPLETVFWIILCVGLAMEFPGGNEAMLISNRINAVLEDKAAAANLEAKRAGTNAAASNERAAIAEREAARANERAAKLEVDKAELERQLSIVWDKSKPRWLLFDSQTLISELKDKPKGTAEFYFLESDQEAYFTATMLSAFISQSGWHVPQLKSITIESARKLGNLGGFTLRSKTNDPAMMALKTTLNEHGFLALPWVDDSLKKGNVKIIIGQKDQ